MTLRTHPDDTEWLIGFLSDLAYDNALPHTPQGGLCSLLVGKVNTQSLDAICEACRRWPEYSRHPSYPVPHPTECAKVAFYNTADMWSSHTEYGRARRRLCAWLSREIEEGRL